MRKYVLVAALLAVAFEGFYLWTTTIKTSPSFANADPVFRLLVDKVCPAGWNQAKWNGAQVNCDGYDWNIIPADHYAWTAVTTTYVTSETLIGATDGELMKIDCKGRVFDHGKLMFTDPAVGNAICGPRYAE